MRFEKFSTLFGRMSDDDDVLFAKAVSEKNFTEIEKLFPRISKGAKRQYITGDAFNPLHYASSPEIVKFFISSGTDVNVKNLETDETPLLTVIKLNKSAAVVRELLKCGASIEARHKYTWNTPLNQAVQIPECALETIQTLLEKGAVVNAANIYCNTPLHNACYCFQGDLKIIELLLRAGSPVNFKNSDGSTSLNVSLQNPHCSEALVKKLLQANAKVSTKALQEAIQINADKYLGIVTAILEHIDYTCVVQWLDILEYLLKNVGNKQKLMDIGRLIIKYAFLKCIRPDIFLMQCLNTIKNCTSCRISFFLKQKTTGFVPECVYKHRAHLLFLSENLKSFMEDCFSEICRMRTEKMLHSNISVLDFIKLKTDKVSSDDQILKILKGNIFPIYADIILRKIKKAALIDKLALQKVYTRVQHGDITRRITLDSFSVCEIAKYLNVDEVKNFLDAFNNSSKHKYCVWDHLENLETQLSQRAKKYRLATKKKLSSSVTHSSPKIRRNTPTRI